MPLFFWVFVFVFCLLATRFTGVSKHLPAQLSLLVVHSGELLLEAELTLPSGSINLEKICFGLPIIVIIS